MAMTSQVKKKVGPASTNGFLSFLKSSDLQLALVVLGIVFVMFIPMPPFLLDILIALSITMSVLILLISTYIKEPLEFSTFPTILLLTTGLRLGLNVASTRSILLDGATGHVSEVIKAFGNFVVGGNYFVGITIFIILNIVNFFVITKGSGRVAEVAARFTLDAMPGKQMAIDAELNAGIIDRDEAKRRRKKVEQEADFYGSMDGASKFVRGDSIAGIIITFVNVLVGLAIGVLQHNLSFMNAASIYTVLSVGDGLVAIVPSILISIAAGIVVTRSNQSQGLSDQLSNQVLYHTRALYVCSGLMFLLGILPGFPLIIFFILGTMFALLARYSIKVNEEKKQKAAEEEANKNKTHEGASDSVESLLKLDTLSIEVGVGLIPLVDTTQDGEILERIISARKQFAQELGIIVPQVMVRDNIQLKPGEYQILLRGNNIGKGQLMPDYFLAMDPGDIGDPVQGIKTKEPAYGLDALWIKSSQKDEAAFKGYTVVNCATIVVTHLTKLIQENAQHLIGRQEVQNLIESVKHEQPKVIEEVIGPDRLTLGDVVKVLQNLLVENVSIRDLPTIFETLADFGKSVKNPDLLTRYVRKSLGRGIIKKYQSNEKSLYVATLDRGVEDMLVSSLQIQEDGTSYLSIDAPLAEKILNGVAKTIRNFDTKGTMPILLCGSKIRWDLHKLIHRFVPGVAVLAFDEIPSDVQTQTVGSVMI